MKKIFLSALTLGAMLTALGTPAGASPPDPTHPVGQKCAANTATDVTAEAQTQAGTYRVGPLVVTSTTPVEVWCQIYVDGNPHSDSDTRLDATVTGAGGVYVAAGANTVSYGPVYIGTVVSMCTFAKFNGKTWYWNPDNTTPPSHLGRWSEVDETFTYLKCAQSTQVDPNPPVCPVLLTIDKYTNNAARLAETWQDCEPYSPII